MVYSNDILVSCGNSRRIKNTIFLKKEQQIKYSNLENKIYYELWNIDEVLLIIINLKIKLIILDVVGFHSFSLSAFQFLNFVSIPISMCTNTCLYLPIPFPSSSTLLFSDR